MPLYRVAFFLFKGLAQEPSSSSVPEVRFELTIIRGKCPLDLNSIWADGFASLVITSDLEGIKVH